ncbi:MAG: hypothetical protein UV73_C0005G0085 [Candidatus Gottesmanbacteria bacterium GW2011_GWA2_43_14]|uniref:Uncharacterized protein n=1 Tax=Candidatus Gottesmanbacteria bacterium GW2011_GWA2_43_14 TaxID=1618443 RepID=A0A0G1GG53_9BACT|nr:MAG: hypothetical protein UV73_C0005G0085 [Candidatus Gottesmanbacteria bacterium GW2011_GWA2_43_14]
MPKISPAKSIQWLIILGALALFLYWKFDVGIRRYFDVDEFAHLHWGYNVHLGNKPYQDFFYNFPPFFLYPMAAIFSVFGRTAASLVAARILMFIVFLIGAFFLFLLSALLRGYFFAAVATTVFIFLPLPYDKLVEVRPDLPSLTAALAGLYFFIRGREGKSRNKFFLSGLFFSLSLALVPKSLFMLLPPLIIFGIDLLRTKGKERMFILKSFLPFALGMLIPGVFLVVLILNTDKPLLAVYSMSRLSVNIANSLSRQFYMAPNLFFYPNDAYYSFAGYNPVYFSNLAIWIGAAIYGIWQFLVSFTLDDEKKSQRLFLLTGVFLANLIGFIRFFPLKHAQYLMPTAPFAALFFTMLWFDFWQKTIPKRFVPIATVTGVVLICILGFRMYRVKRNWTNAGTLAKLERILNKYPADSPIFDLTGETVFFPDGYYFCCLPYGQYQQTLLFDYPALEYDMDKKNTLYVHAGIPERLNVIPDMHRKYLEDNFQWSDDGMMERK